MGSEGKEGVFVPSPQTQSKGRSLTLATTALILSPIFEASTKTWPPLCDTCTGGGEVVLIAMGLRGSRCEGSWPIQRSSCTAHIQHQGGAHL